MTTSLPSVSVIIPVRNSAETVARAVSSALEQEYAGALEVVIAEGRSTDESRAIVDAVAARDSRVRVVDNPSGGTPTGLNAALRVSHGDVIVRCDAHAELPAGYVAAAVRRLDETGAGAVGGIQDARGETAFERAVAYAMANPLGSGGAAYRRHGAAGFVDTVYLGVFRRSTLRAVGLYDASLARNQDYELNHRIATRGGGVYFAPELRVRYRPRGSLGALWRQYFQYGRWKRVVLRRWPGSLRARQLAAPLLVAGLVGSPALAVSPWAAAGLVLPVTYGAVLAMAALTEAVRRRDPAGLLVAPTLATMHVAWGVGFWAGPPDVAPPAVGSFDT